MGTPLSPKYLPSSDIDLRGSRVQLDENRRFEHGICEFHFFLGFRAQARDLGTPSPKP